MIRNHPVELMSKSTGVRLPPIGESGRDGPSFTNGMVPNVNQNQLIYRSVPPNPSSYTFSDMLGPSISPGKQSRATVVSSNTPSEFAERFKSRPTTKPKVVEFDVGRVSTDTKRRKVNGFFPPVKLRKSSRILSGENIDAPLLSTSRMQLAPSSLSDTRAKVDMMRTPQPVRRTPESVRTSQTAPEVSIIYPNILTENMDYDDISMLPPPKRILPRRELPWVFRYKVKRNMNELAKIMASKASATTATPTPLADQAT